MKTAKELHEDAMSLYEEALVAKFKGEEKARVELLSQAYELEKQAAMFLKDRYDLEPTRSKLFASCATMAFQLKAFRESETLIALGLSGTPTEDVLEELRDLFDKVNFHRHLQLKGIELTDNEFSFTLGSGNEIMKGMARGDEITSRITSIEALYGRTWQRMNNKPYQSKGRISEQEDNIIQLFCKTPIAASFAIIFSIPEKPSLFPELESMVPIVDEMLQCIDLVNEGKIDELKEKIPDESYFQSFLINARNIAPDGKNVKHVGFTVNRNNQEETHPFNRVKSKIALYNNSIENKALEEVVNDEKREKTTVSGVLLVSDSPKRFITVVQEIKQYRKDGALKKSKFVRHKIKFITEAQKELVRDHYEEDVSVEVWKYPDNSLEFIDLKLTE